MLRQTGAKSPGFCQKKAVKYSKNRPGMPPLNGHASWQGQMDHPAQAPRANIPSPEDSGEEGALDEEAAALARIRNRSSSRRSAERGKEGDEPSYLDPPPTAAKRQKVDSAPVETDNWVCCDRCNKWRLLRKDVFERTVTEDKPWFCEYNYGRCGKGAPSVGVAAVSACPGQTWLARPEPPHVAAPGPGRGLHAHVMCGYVVQRQHGLLHLCRGGRAG